MNAKPIFAIALMFAMVFSFSGIANLGIAEEQAQEADLIVGEVWWNPEEPTSGDIVEIHAVIKNNGTAVAENFYVAFYKDGQVAIGSVKIERLGSGEGKTIGVEWNTIGQAGENLITVIANANETVEESNEDNNYFHAKIFVEKAEQGEEHVVLKGVVYNSKTNETIANAWISLYTTYDPMYSEGMSGKIDYKYYTTTSDENGNYELKVARGDYTLTCSAENYEYYSKPVIIKENTTHNIFLNPYPPPSSVLQGYVYSFNSGKPIHKAMITLSPYYDYYYPEKNYGYYYTAYTDENGSYSISVHRGSYSISVYAEGHEGYYAPINIPENKTMNFDIALKKIFVPEKNCKVKGIVKDAKTLKPIVKAMISIYLGKIMPMEMSSNGMMDSSMMNNAEMPMKREYDDNNYYDGNYEAYTNENGEYVVETTAGYFYMTVWAEGYESYYSAFEIADNTTHTIDVLLKPFPEPNSEVNGHVYNLKEEPISPALVYVYRDYTIWSTEKGIEPMSVEPTRSGTNNGMNSETEDDDENEHDDDENEHPSEEYQKYNVEYDDDYFYKDVEYYDGYFYKEVKTDEKGYYSLKIPEGNYIIQVYADGYAPYYGNFKIADGKTITINIKLKKGEEYNYSIDMMKPKARKNFDGKQINFVPKVKKELGEIKIKAGEKIKINLKDYFDDIDSNLTFRYTGNNKIIVIIDANSATTTIEAPKDFKGDEELTFYASDGDVEISSKSIVSVESGTAGSVGISSIAIYVVAILVAVGVIFGVRYLQTRRQ